VSLPFLTSDVAHKLLALYALTWGAFNQFIYCQAKDA
jgi:hypothetical protein